MPYRELVRFLLPLVVTSVAYGIGPQVLNGGMARGAQPTQTLAAFALAWGLADFLASPMSQVRQLGLVLVEDRPQAGRVLRFVLACGAALAGALAVLALTSAGPAVVEGLHGAAPDLAAVVRFAFLVLVPYPLLEGLQRLLSGLLLRVRRTDVVSAATVAGVGASVAAVFALQPTELVTARPIWLPVLVTYAGALANLAVLAWGHSRFVAPWLVRASAPGRAAPALTAASLVAFFWPLALIMAIQGLSRPTINLFVSRGADGELALAALGVVYPLALMPYGWVNELRSLPAAFQEHGEPGLHRIRRFSGACGALSFALMAVAFWVPPVRDLVLERLLSLPPEVAQRCHGPLALFCLFPLTVAVRSYMHGVAVLERRTRSLAPSAPARFATIAAVLVGLGERLPGATRGIAALLAGFVLEAATAWWFVRRKPLPASGAVP